MAQNSHLTVAEKEHWKKRIQQRIDAKIDEIVADHPALMPDMLEKARKQTYDRLGLTKPQTRLKKLLDRKKDLEEEIHATQEEICCKVLEITPRAFAIRGEYDCKRQVEEALKRQIGACRQRLLAKDPVGKQIISLQTESEQVLDTVWLATSPQQVKDLWDRVVKFLSQKHTALQAEAMSLPPMEGSLPLSQDDSDVQTDIDLDN